MLSPTALSGEDSPQQQSEPQAILSFLNQTIVWYRQQGELKQLASDPSDVLFLNDNTQLADDIVRESFDFARARAQLLSASSSAAASGRPASAASNYQNLTAMETKTDALYKQAEANIESLRRQLETATGRKRATLEALLAEAQSEADLIQTRRDALKDMAQFLGGANGVLGSGSLQQQIDELARTVFPTLATEEKTASAAKPQTNNTQLQLNASTSKKNEPSGILALITDLLALRRKMETLDAAINSTDALANSAKTIRTPLIADLRALVAKGDQLANAPESQDPAELTEQKKKIDVLTAQFRQGSAAVLPLGKQGVLLDLYKRTLGNWRSNVEAARRAELKGLILRLAIVGVIIGLIATVSELWKRATFRYVHDVRRRYQFLLLRRIVVWIVIAIVVASAFAAELGTLATFAGLLTAGVAVALQNVILSVAGYFFLIGKYGVRVGDRVQVAGVTGDVIDIGLVRLHIMEIDADATDARATGRVVVFSNAVAFQPNAGLFKQIPGTNFVWHQITLIVAAESSYELVEQRLKTAVDAVYADYKGDMERQRRRMEQSLNTVSIGPLDPETRLRLTQTGLEVVIRYPVELSNAASIDDRMARALLDAIAQEPRLRLVGSGTPNIQPVAEPAPMPAR